MPALNIIDRYGLTSAGAPGAVTLSSAYTSGGTSLVVSSTTGLPSGTCNFWLIVQSEGAHTEEVFQCTNVNLGTSTLTVVGAQAGTSASSHASGANVLASIWTADAFAQYSSDVGSSRPGVLWSGSSDPGAPSITLVQSTKSGNNATSLAFGSNVTSGNLLIVVIGSANSSLSVLPNVSDTLGNTWTKVKGNNSGDGVAIAYAFANGSGATTVSISAGSGAGNSMPQFTSILVAEFSSANLSSTVDVSAGGSSAPSLTLTQGYDLVISGSYYASSTAAAATSPEVVFQNTSLTNSTAGAWVLATAIGAFTTSLTAPGGTACWVSIAFKTTAITTFGVDLDWYINTTTGELWQRNSGIWNTTGFKWSPG